MTEEQLQRAEDQEARLFDEAYRFARQHRREVRKQVRAAVRSKDYGRAFELSSPETTTEQSDNLAPQDSILGA